jgi:hypothetical protein
MQQEMPWNSGKSFEGSSLDLKRRAKPPGHAFLVASGMNYPDEISGIMKNMIRDKKSRSR